MKPKSFNVHKRLGLLLLPLIIATLPACQTTSPPSSSSLKEMAKDEVIITRKSACEALAPERVTREEFDAMSQDERNERAGEAAAWGTLCAGL